MKNQKSLSFSKLFATTLIITAGTLAVQNVWAEDPVEIATPPAAPDDTTRPSEKADDTTRPSEEASTRPSEMPSSRPSERAPAIAHDEPTTAPTTFPSTEPSAPAKGEIPAVPEIAAPAPSPDEQAHVAHIAETLVRMDYFRKRFSHTMDLEKQKRKGLNFASEYKALQEKYSDLSKILDAELTYIHSDLKEDLVRDVQIELSSSANLVTSDKQKLFGDESQKKVAIGVLSAHDLEEANKAQKLDGDYKKRMDIAGKVLNVDHPLKNVNFELGKKYVDATPAKFKLNPASTQPSKASGKVSGRSKPSGNGTDIKHKPKKKADGSEGQDDSDSGN